MSIPPGMRSGHCTGAVRARSSTRQPGYAGVSASWNDSLGANILGQLGTPDRTFPEECVRVLLDMLNAERAPEVLRTILVALGHYPRPEVVVAALRFRRHEDSRGPRWVFSSR